MEFSANLSDPPIAALILACAGKSASVKWCQENCLTVKGVKFETPSAIARFLAHNDKKNLWYGSNPLEESEVNHWVSYAVSDLWSSDITSSPTALPYLDRSLAPATFLVGNQCSLADIVVWGKLFCSEVWQSLLASKTAPKNVKRWFDFISHIDFVAEAVKKLPDNVRVAQKESQSGGRKEEGKFVDLPGAEMGKVVVRFPPEASGYLHIGHAKAALLNQYYQQTFNGKLIMRFDDTNPAKEKVDFEKVILEDLELLQVKYDIFSHTSNYFDLMLQMCEKLMKEGKAYADDTDPETMKSEREQRVASKNRSNSVEKNFKMWDEMKRGTALGQKCCIRAKIDMASANGCMRDPTIYRCKNEPHPRTGDKYKVYPTYDFACPIVDSIEGVTHCLRTTEYHDRDDQFYWFIDAMGLRKPYVWEYSRLNMTNTVLSKRKLTWFVENGYVDGWDDPRMPTVRGVLRRGMTVEGLRQFIIAQGSSRSVVLMEWDKIWAINKKVIDPIAPRYSAVDASHVTVTIAGVQEGSMKAAKHPKNPEVGEKTVWMSSKVLIDEADAVLLKEGEDVTFINWGNITIKKIDRNGDKITGISAVPNLDNKNYKKTLKITWLAETPKAPFTPCICVYFDHIISKAILGKEEDFKQFIGHNTKTEIEMIGDPELANLKKSDIIQLQRKGFFICDRPYSPSNIHSGIPTPVVLFYIPDGHTKDTPSSVSKNPSSENQKPVGSKSDVTSLLTQITEVGNKIRDLKAAKSDKQVIADQVKVLLELKGKYKSATGTEWTPAASQPSSKTSEAPQQMNASTIAQLVQNQGDLVRQMKNSKASKDQINEAVQKLLALKEEYKNLTGQEYPKDGKPPTTPVTTGNADDLSKQITIQGNNVRDLKASKANKIQIDAAVKELLMLKQKYKDLAGKDWLPSAQPAANTKLDNPDAMSEKITAQGNRVRELKLAKADKNAIDHEVKVLLSLKQKYKEVTGNDWIPPPSPQKTDSADLQGLSVQIAAQGDKVRALKVSKSDKNKIDAEVKELLSLKQKYKEFSGKDWAPPASPAPLGLGKDNELEAVIKAQGDTVRALKSSNSPKEEVDKAVQKLLALKEEFKQVTGNAFPKEGANKEKAKTKAPKPSKPEVKKESDTAVKKVTRLGLEATKEDNLPDWYSQVIVKGELIEYYDVSGCYILRPWSFAIWEIIRDWFDAEIKKLGVKNCYFPIFVSRAVLEKEKTHVADFAPEVAWVTKSGDSDLAEPIAIRPTSETVMYPAYAKWIQSYRDLPIKLNQWNNVVRWEFKHPQPFLRTREFLWQEGHTAFSSYKEAEEEVYAILRLYEEVYTRLLAIPVVKGRKTEKEKFAGGDYTLTVEAFISASGRAIQGATSHHLGQNFSKMFEIIYEDPETQEKKFVYQNSWGMTTRTIGVMIMVHADNQGLVLPPRVASIQVIIVPCGITASLPDSEKNKLVDLCNTIKSNLTNGGVRADTDLRENYSPGWKFNHWELKGVPIRVEVGPKDMQKNQIVAVRRDTGAKITFPLISSVQDIQDLLDKIHKDMFAKANDDLNSHMVVCRQWSDFTRQLDSRNIIQAPFCGRIECEDKIKEESARTQPENTDVNAPSMGAKSLCIPLAPMDQIHPTDKCIHPSCSASPKYFTLFGRSY